jgi:hypothetical protein
VTVTATTFALEDIVDSAGFIVAVVVTDVGVGLGLGVGAVTWLEARA